MRKKEFSTDVAGVKLTAIFSDLAEQADGSVVVKYGDTAILATAVMSKERREGDYFPLTVDFEERFYAAGKILGSQFVRREGKPSDAAILSGRIVDRTIRPLFDPWMRNEVQVVVTVLGLGDEDAATASVIAASLALGTSHIPWNGPVSCARIAEARGAKGMIVNPPRPVRDAGLSLDLLACGKGGMINMIEVGAQEAPEKAIEAALSKAASEIEKLQLFQERVIGIMGAEKLSIEKPELPKIVAALFDDEIAPKLDAAVFSGAGKEPLSALKGAWMELANEKWPEHSSAVDSYFEERVNKLLHDEAIDENRRADGRKMDEIRPIYAQAGGISNMLHGSGIFYRGETHVLSVATLASPDFAQTVDGMDGAEKKYYMHHYNFPPYSTGETGRSGTTNRRMIGHGALAEKALLPVLPPREKFPYAIRVVSEAFSSNGSTSMASVCGSTIALMDAGVPISSPVAGIASGLMMRESRKKALVGKKKYEYKILTDIQGPEDHHGDMDFKVAGTRKGITAMQMDVKVSGVPISILSEALSKARAARLRILDAIEDEISKPRGVVSPRAPKILTTKIRTDDIGLVIGAGGKTIKEIKESTGAEITIEDDGTVYLTGSGDSAERAKAIVEDMTRVYKTGDVFEGEVTKVLDFGAFVRIGRNAEGLVHISELAPWKVTSISDLVKPGDKVPVVVKEVDEKGRLSLSIKKINSRFFDKPEKAA